MKKLSCLAFAASSFYIATNYLTAISATNRALEKIEDFGGNNQFRIPLSDLTIVPKSSLEQAIAAGVVVNPDKSEERT